MLITLFLVLDIVVLKNIMDLLEDVLDPLNKFGCTIGTSLSMVMGYYIVGSSVPSFSLCGLSCTLKRVNPINTLRIIMNIENLGLCILNFNELLSSHSCVLLFSLVVIL